MSEQRRGSASTIVSSVSDSLSTVSSECQLTYRLLDLMQKTDYNLVQENGQRRLTAPEQTKHERMKGAEVFLGRLPRDCYEDELMPLLQRAGRLLELRLMLDFSGTTRGYAFALYEDSKTARAACNMLDGHEIRPGHPIGAVKSIDNCRLFFGGVPKTKTKEEFFEELSKLMDGIVDIYLYPNAQDRSLNRGFIFVEFKDHRSAAMARRKLIPGRVLLWDHEVAVDWADPEPGEPVDEEIMENVTALFVRNLSMEISQQKIRDVFIKETNIPIVKLKKINHFAFIHYETREMAEVAMKIITKPGGVAEQEKWEIRWAKPIGPIKQAERQRCINEAISQTKNHKKFEDKKNGRRQSPKMHQVIPPPTNHLQESFNLPYVNILSEFVIKNFHASCSYECIPSNKPEGFFHKVVIFRNNIAIFVDYGTLQPTIEASLNSAAFIAYEKLVRSVYDYNTYNMYPQVAVDDITSHMTHMNISNTNNFGMQGQLASTY